MEFRIDVYVADIGDGMYVAQARSNGVKSNGLVSGNKLVAARSAVERLLSQDNAEGMVAVTLAMQGKSIEDSFPAIAAEPAE